MPWLAEPITEMANVKSDVNFNPIDCCTVIAILNTTLHTYNISVTVCNHPGLGEIFAPDGVTGSDIIS